MRLAILSLCSIVGFLDTVLDWLKIMLKVEYMENSLMASLKTEDLPGEIILKNSFRIIPTTNLTEGLQLGI